MRPRRWALTLLALLSLALTWTVTTALTGPAPSVAPSHHQATRAPDPSVHDSLSGWGPYLVKVAAWSNAVEQAQALAAQVAAQALAAEQAAAEAASRAASARSTAVPVTPLGSTTNDGGWAQVAICEEGGRNDPTYGFLGILPASWGGYGGVPVAGDADWATQVARADQLNGGGPPYAPAGCAAAGYHGW